MTSVAHNETGGLHTEEDLTEFLTGYPEQMALGDEEPGRILDRWFAPGFVFRNDGLVLERQRLIDHVRPARRNARAISVDVHAKLLSNNGIAAHYTLHATMRTGAVVSTEIFMVGGLAEGGRISAIEQRSRMLGAP
jgi:hypothetical protein